MKKIWLISFPDIWVNHHYDHDHDCDHHDDHNDDDYDHNDDDYDHHIDHDDNSYYEVDASDNQNFVA